MKPQPKSLRPLARLPVEDLAMHGLCRIQPNRHFESEQEIRDYAFERGARIEKIWKPDLYACVLIMVTPKAK